MNDSNDRNSSYINYVSARFDTANYELPSKSFRTVVKKNTNKNIKNHSNELKRKSKNIRSKRNQIFLYLISAETPSYVHIKHEK